MSLKGRVILISEGMDAIGVAVGLRAAPDATQAVIAREYLTAVELPGMTKAPVEGRFATVLSYEGDCSWPAVATRKVK
jgi:hypothetical protein